MSVLTMADLALARRVVECHGLYGLNPSEAARLVRDPTKVIERALVVIGRLPGSREEIDAELAADRERIRTDDMRRSDDRAHLRRIALERARRTM